MRLARYWSKATREARAADGRAYRLTCWRGSWDSLAQAQQRAQAAIQDWFDKLQRGEPLGQYEYQDKFLREQLLEAIHDSDDNLIGAITRNRYGALVLNASNVLFADIDADISPVSLWDRIAAWFGQPKKDKAYRLQQIQQVIRQRPELALVIYETYAGYRVVATAGLFSPRDSIVQQLFKELQCDELYVRMCLAQDCFRARLSAKPWRIGVPRPPVGFPRDADQEQVFERWLQDYEQRARDTGVCRTVGAVWSNSSPPTIATILRVHDRYSLAYVSQALA